MRALQVILGMVALLLVSIQTFRHAYVLWVEPRGSVLDNYNKTEQKIGSAESLQELLAHYEKARAEEEKSEKEKSERMKEPPDPVTREREYLGVSNDTPTYLLKKAIETWEAHDKQLYQLHFYWWTGLGSLLLGILGYYFINRWFGMTGIIAGASEMIFWTSPPFRAGGAHAEFDRLLLLKFIYSTATYVLVFGLVPAQWPVFTSWNN